MWGDPFPSSSSSSGISAGGVIGIVVAVLFVLGGAAFVLKRKSATSYEKAPEPLKAEVLSEMVFQQKDSNDRPPRMGMQGPAAPPNIGTQGPKAPPPRMPFPGQFAGQMPMYA